ncbi:MAG: hypothetical protein ABUS51_07505, partial [Acidobacteriota bacterium]
AGILRDFVRRIDRPQFRFRLGIAMSVTAKGERRIERVLDGRRRLSPRLTLRQKALVFGLGFPALVLLAGAQSARQEAGPAAGVAPPGVRAPRHRVPSPLFSSAYVEALRGVIEIEPKDAAELEERLAKNPDDFTARLKLLAYCQRPDRVDLPESRRERTALVLWLVEHRPDSEILGSPYAVVFDDLAPDELQRAFRLWESATETRTSDARVWWNAASFYRQANRGRYLAALERAVALAPDNRNYAQNLGLLYAGAILSVDPQSLYREEAWANGADLARHATGELDKTRNAYVLEPAVRLLQSDYNRSLMMGKENQALGVTAKQYFQRAKALDPDLDEQWIYPAIEPGMAGMLAPGAHPPDAGRVQFEDAAKQIRRLAPDTFTNLPAAIRAALRLRGCTIPQPNSDATPKNVIQGEFFAAGQTGWAVLCSVHESSSLLVFRSGSDPRPEELARREDKIYLRGNGNGIEYARDIRIADRKFIMTHYRAYGGPKPPPIDHQGIDDANGNASVTHYWYQGRWRELTGAD